MNAYFDVSGGGAASRSMSESASSSASSAPPAPPLRLLGHNQQRRLLSLQRIASHIASLPGGAPPAHLSGVYQFGVLHGFGLRAWLEAMPMLNLSLAGKTVWGFDSFRGMPDEEAGFMRKSHEHDRQWHAGGLNVARLLGISYWPKLHDTIVRNIGFSPEHTHLVRGFYNESLRGGRALSQQLRMPPALLLDIDCDLYTSTTQALRFMLDSQLLVPGTYVYYDDYSVEAWYVPASQHPYLEERLAHEEVTKEYELVWRPLNRYGRYRGPMAGLEWIRQMSNTSKWMGKQVSFNNLNPVFRLEACGKCNSPHRRVAAAHRGILKGGGLREAEKAFESWQRSSQQWDP